MIDPTIAVAGLSLLGTVVGLIFTWVQSSRKASSDTVQGYYDDLQVAFEKMQDRLDQMETYISALEGHVDELHTMMILAGLKPPPRPKRPRRGGE